MWEAIAANQRRSRILILLMGLLLALTGLSIGYYYEPEAGPFVGLAGAFALWLIMLLTALYAGDSILLGTAGAHRIQKEDSPQLWNIVEEMQIASGLTVMPELYIIEDDGLNAFAVGRKPEKAAVAVTSGLLKRLNRDELQGVVAHEIGHIRNLDIRFMTLASVMVGCISILSEIFFRSMRFGGGRRSSKKGDGAAILLLVAVLVAVLAPLAAQVLYFACSRSREYLADASAARFTRFPAGLASALHKISSRAGLQRVSKAAAPLFIVNPLAAAGDEGWFSTHPPLEKRIAILEGMGSQAGFSAYEAAFRSTQGGKAHLLSGRILAEGEVPARAAAAPPDEPAHGEDQTERVRQVTDMLARFGDYLILPCACGVKIKLPPEFRGDVVKCPRCGTEHRVPQAQLMAALATLPASARAAAAPADQAPLVYQRRGAGWESFRCSCGQTQQLSPNFSGSRLSCRKCGRVIEIAGSPEPAVT